MIKAERSAGLRGTCRAGTHDVLPCLFLGTPRSPSPTSPVGNDTGATFIESVAHSSTLFWRQRASPAGRTRAERNPKQRSALTKVVRYRIVRAVLVESESCCGGEVMNPKTGGFDCYPSRLLFVHPYWAQNYEWESARKGDDSRWWREKFACNLSCRVYFFNWVHHSLEVVGLFYYECRRRRSTGRKRSKWRISGKEAATSSKNCATEALHR